MTNPMTLTQTGSRASFTRVLERIKYRGLLDAVGDFVQHPSQGILTQANDTAVRITDGIFKLRGDKNRRDALHSARRDKNTVEALLQPVVRGAASVAPGKRIDDNTQFSSLLKEGLQEEQVIGSIKANTMRRFPSVKPEDLNVITENSTFGDLVKLVHTAA